MDYRMSWNTICTIHKAQLAHTHTVSCFQTDMEDDFRTIHDSTDSLTTLYNYTSLSLTEALSS